MCIIFEMCVCACLVHPQLQLATCVPLFFVGLFLENFFRPLPPLIALISINLHQKCLSFSPSFACYLLACLLAIAINREMRSGSSKQDENVLRARKKLFYFLFTLFLSISISIITLSECRSHCGLWLCFFGYYYWFCLEN